MYVCMYLMNIRTYVCTYVCMYVCTYVCTYVGDDNKVRTTQLVYYIKNGKEVCSSVLVLLLGLLHYSSSTLQDLLVLA